MEKINPSGGVRKGIWTPEEDILLKKCIQTYGEGKWHLVPLRAGLNRCRKSCRLRWLNYLKPDIKRGQFTKDEVDLIIRLHKLLGNRWSLIAGRLPGRTANDVKNCWNTHIEKKLLVGEAVAGRVNAQKSVTVVRPQPRTFSQQLENGSKNKQLELPSSSHADECISWWTNLLEMSTDQDAGMGGTGMDTGHNQNLGEEGEGGGDDDLAADFTVGLDIWELLCYGDDS